MRLTAAQIDEMFRAIPTDQNTALPIINQDNLISQNTNLQWCFLFLIVNKSLQLMHTSDSESSILHIKFIENLMNKPKYLDILTYLILMITMNE